MPRNGSGTYSLPAGNPVVAGDVIEAAWANTTLADVANELTNSLSRNGNGGMLAPFRVADGSVSAPGLGFTNETNTGLYRAGSGEIWLTVGGIAVAQVTVNGMLIPAGKRITLPAPVNTTDATNKEYVDDLVAPVIGYADFYLGPKSSDPLVNNSGGALTAGTTYWSTTLDQMRVYNGTNWVPMPSTASLQGQTFSGTGAQTAFTLAAPSGNATNLEVFISGVRQVPTTDYSVTGTTLTFTSAPPSGTNNIYVRFAQLIALASADASNVSYVPSGTGAVATTVQTKLRETVSVKDFGADPTGGTDSSAAIAAAFAASNKVLFPDGTYLMNSGVTKLANNVEVDFGNAKIINGGTGFLFTFGATADTPNYTGLKICGGWFEQSNPATVSNYNYIKVAAIKDFVIRNVYLKNVSNGGICVEAGCQDGVIDGCTIDGASGYSTCRGIWLNGSTASDYASQLVDTGTITRNGTPVPVYAAKNIKIANCTVVLPAYGVYLMNTRDCSVENCYVDVSGVGALRCVAVNNYSPGAKITGNTLISDRSSTGVLVTQASDNVVIADNVFEGDFGGNRDVFVQYLAEALIQGNQFNTQSTQCVEVSMGGFALIKGNHFNKGSRTADYRCVYAHPIDAADAGGAVGDTATVLAGLVFQDNIVRYRCRGVFVDTNSYASTSGNKPAMGVVQVKNNIFMNMNLAATSAEYPLHVVTGTSANVTRYSYTGNEVLPNTAANRNTVQTSGTALYAENTETYLGNFTIDVAAGGGAITVTKIAGANYSISASRSGGDLVLTPRTIAASSGASVAVPFGFMDLGGTIYRFAVRRSGSNYQLTAYDSAGSAINFASVAGSFSVLIGAVPNT